MKDGKVLETFTIFRQVEHTGEAIAMYKLAIDESVYTKSDYDIVTTNEELTSHLTNKMHRERTLILQGKGNCI